MSKLYRRLSKYLNVKTGVMLAGCLLLTFSAQAVEFEHTGKVGVEARYFFDEGVYSAQLDSTQNSLYFEPEFFWGWNNGADNLTFRLFYRKDGQDNERTHGDIRELSYVHAGNDWELRVGIRKEFWGVTEFQHLVDVINQSDSVEDTDGEDKLGQQMINLSTVNDWGIVDLYVLPGFRERTFAGKKGRLRGSMVVDNDHVTYESGAENKHVDLAARWTHSIGNFDIGSYWFRGTNREPILRVAREGEDVVLRQFYGLMDQFGVDLQATISDWLWKFESIYRDTKGESFWATQAGFEYTYAGAYDSAADFGVLMEYSWDSRGEVEFQENGSNSTGASLQNDLFLGGRLALNDAQSSEMLLGIGSDLDHNAVSFVAEASRRFGDRVKASVDIRLFNSTDRSDQIYGLNDDDHMQLSIELFF